MNSENHSAKKTREVRAYLGITQSELGNLLNMHLVTISRIENGLYGLTARNSTLIDRFLSAPIPEYGVSRAISEMGATNVMLKLANHDAF